MPRYKLTIEYDGTGLHGWQKQPEFLTVQGLLEAAIASFCGQTLEIFCAGRTDAGVHALAQVAHVDLPKTYPPYSIQQAINFHLGEDTKISVIQVEAVTDEFHARFSATGRRYMYRIINRSARLAVDAGRAWHIPETLDAAAMHIAAQELVGHHDFSSFRDSQCQAASPIKTLERLDVLREGDEIRIYGASRSFLHHQMRNMVGSLRLVGNGKWSTDDLIRARDAKNRTAGGETAEPQGLYLTQVVY